MRCDFKVGPLEFMYIGEEKSTETIAGLFGDFVERLGDERLTEMLRSDPTVAAANGDAAYVQLTSDGQVAAAEYEANPDDPCTLDVGVA